MDKIIEILKEYAQENGTTIRSTSDLSCLEIWLINKLIKEREFEKMMDDLQDGKISAKIPLKEKLIKKQK